jgi:UrcA family protein
MIMNRIAAIAVATLVAAGLAGPTFAAETFTARVKTSDLNLQTPDGTKRALERVRRAAERACSDYTVGSRIGHPDAECVTKVSAELVRRMNEPTVQAAFEANRQGRG